MARMARKKSGSGVYHVVVRGINRQTIFFDDEDKKVFLNRIKLHKAGGACEVYAFCLMGNHAHLLIKEKAKPVAKIMQGLLASYVRWFNRKYEREGGLFQDRYKASP